jgi:hypothetical protein
MRERLEQLRALEAGMRIDAEIVSTVPLGVDTPEDLERARELPILKAQMSRAPTNKISFQGEPGANSDTACRNMFPDMSRCRARLSRTLSTRSRPARPISP